jgi:hypothetical protein
MHILYNRAGSESEVDITSEAQSNEKNIIGYQDGYQRSKSVEFKLIKIVNSKISLDSVLSKYEIRFEEVYNVTGWTKKCSCPFKDHNDSSPSFGFNPKLDVFNCFGCHRSGRAVEFYAYYENISIYEAAHILAKSIDLDNISDIEIENDLDFNKFQEIIFDYADFIRKFKRDNKNNLEIIKYVENITWNLDVYIRQHSIYNSFILDDLNARIFKLKEQLSYFGE